jgi:photosystem II stability/assembly factor-like uncharacterized protein
MHKKCHSYAIHSRKTDKDRAVWFQQNVAFPMRDATPVELERFWALQVNADLCPEHRWECLGPNNIAGRVTALLIHPENPNQWFAGSATGGVWVSNNAGESWTPTWSRYANQNIGAMAWITGEGSPVLLAGTGEANMSPDTYPGSGVYRSFDAGLTWVPGFDNLAENIHTFPRRISSIACRGARIAIGSVFLDNSLPAGLYLSDYVKGDLMRPCEFWGRRSYDCHSVLFHPQDRNTLFASIEPDGAHNGIWRSRNFGKTWTHLTRGLPSADQFGRTTLAFAPSNPNVIYALAANQRSHILGVFRSADGGESWREILGGRRYSNERQMSYNNVIAVHPANPDSVVWGGMHLYRTDNAGRHWRRITNSDGGENHVHGDHHALLWPEENLIVSGNDGGVAVSRDGGWTWADKSRGMVTAMFYDLDVAPTDEKIFAGGTQDNGIVIAGIDGVPDGDMLQPITGDGAWVKFDPADPHNVFACTSGFKVFHHRSGNPWKYHPGWTDISPKQIPQEEATQREYTVIAIQRSPSGVKTLWAGSTRLWRTNTNGRRWKPASPVFDKTPISAIEISHRRPKLMFAGTTGGGIFRSKDGGCTWSQSLSSIDIPQRAITHIAFHPKHPETVVVTIAASGVRSSGVELKTGKNLPYSHVFRSEDLGETWEDIDAGQLPNVVYYAAAYETRPPYRLFIAGDVGVWVEAKRGWLNISGNLPCVVVSDLVYHHKSRTLTAATYGRGVWRMAPGKLIGPSAASSALHKRIPAPAGDVDLLYVTPGLRLDPSVPAPVQLTPPNGAVIKDPKRIAVMSVKPVPNAMGYQVELEQTKADGVIFLTSSATEKISVTASARGKWQWRVWAILPDGLRSPASRWRRITFSG